MHTIVRMLSLRSKSNPFQEDTLYVATKLGFAFQIFIRAVK